MASPERVVTSIPLLEARRCSSCSPTATGKGSTSYTVHDRVCVHFRKICDCVGAVRRLWGGLGQSRGAVGWWGGGGVAGRRGGGAALVGDSIGDSVTVLVDVFFGVAYGVLCVVAVAVGVLHGASVVASVG